MNKNEKMIRKIGGLGLAGAMVFGASSAMAEDFTASADVQNALAITIVQEMNFGTLFAAEANDDAISAITLDPNGDISAIAPVDHSGAATLPDDAPAFLTLGGAQAARGSVASGQPFTLTVPAGVAGDLTDGAGTWTPGTAVPVTVNNDPAEAAFYLTDFIIGDAPDATVTAGGATNEFDVAPDFGITTVEFGIGATINTDAAGAPRDSYQQATYTGTFEVTAAF